MIRAIHIAALALACGAAAGARVHVVRRPAIRPYPRQRRSGAP